MSHHICEVQQDMPVLTKWCKSDMLGTPQKGTKKAPSPTNKSDLGINGTLPEVAPVVYLPFCALQGPSHQHPEQGSTTGTKRC